MQLSRRWDAPAAMLVTAALLLEGPATSSAFIFSTTPAVPSLALRQRYDPADVSVGINSQRSRLHPAANRRTKARREASTMILGGAGGLAPAMEAIVSTAMDQAQAHAFGAGAGMFLLAEEMPAPPNIYGPIAQGGVLIVLSGVFAAYMMVVIVTNMSPEDLMEVNKGLAGGDEVDDLEEQRLSIRKRLKAITKDIEEGNDPTLGMGMTPTGERAEKIEETTERALQTDIASIEDEYDD